MNFFKPYHEENRSKILFIGSSLISVYWSIPQLLMGQLVKPPGRDWVQQAKKILDATGNQGL